MEPSDDSRLAEQRLVDWSDLTARIAVAFLAAGVITALWTYASATGRSANVWGANVTTTLLGTGLTILAVDLIADRQNRRSEDRKRAALEAPLRSAYEDQLQRLGRLLGDFFSWMLLDAWVTSSGQEPEGLSDLRTLSAPSRADGLEAAFMLWFCTLPTMRLGAPARTYFATGDWRRSATAELARLENTAERIFLVYGVVLTPAEAANLGRVVDFLSYSQRWVAVAHRGGKASLANRVDRIRSGEQSSIRSALSALWPNREVKYLMASTLDRSWVDETAAAARAGRRAWDAEWKDP